MSNNSSCTRGASFSSIIVLLLLLPLLLSLRRSMCRRPSSVASSRSSCSKRLAAAWLGAIAVRLLGTGGGILPLQASGCTRLAAGTAVAVTVAYLAVTLVVEIPATAAFPTVWLPFRRLPCWWLRAWSHHWSSRAVVAIKDGFSTPVVPGGAGSVVSGETDSSSHPLPTLICVGRLGEGRRGVERLQWYPFRTTTTRKGTQPFGRNRHVVARR